jgi:hypothetical protein
MKIIGFIFAVLLSITAPGSALCGQFDCAKPQFGVLLSDINENNYFIKYSEVGNVSYYNYTGPCVMPLHSHVVPSIVYGFVNNQLYARIIRTSNDSLDRILKHIPPSFGEPKRKQNGDVIQLSWENKAHETKLKIKFNTKTKEAKSVTSFQPLRPTVGASAMLAQ